MPVDKSTAEHYLWGQGCDGWHFLKRDDLSVIQERVPPGQSERSHLHIHARQFFYILSGEAVLTLGPESYSLQAGQGLEVPPGTPHQFMNRSASDVTFLVISSPKSHGDRVDQE